MAPGLPDLRYLVLRANQAIFPLIHQAPLWAPSCRPAVGPARKSDAGLRQLLQ
jgi:hypothetical protein